MEFETRCIHAGQPSAYHSTGAVSMPIFQTATFAHPGVGQSTGFDYSRLQNPTREQLEQVVAGLENASHAFAFSTGMAALTAMMELFAPGDHIIASDDLYGGSHRLFFSLNAKNGIAVSLVPTQSLAAVEGAIQKQTKAIFIETPTNPMMNVTDIAAVAQLCKKHGLLLIVDNTFLTPYLQKPLLLGADLVLHSGTKYLGGHNDTLAGFLATSHPALAERLLFICKTTGACLAPFDSWLVIRGIKTLAVRMERQQKTAEQLALWLLAHPKVRQVYYAGLPQHPGYEISKKQAGGAGAMLSFRVDLPETAQSLLQNVKIIQFAESLGGVESLVTYPMLQTHADVPEAERLAQGIDDTLLRLSVGLEAAEDLIADLDAALGGQPV
ncbi:MAG: trans-sulfuration enzyme family protein [Oscillospiraceae bacterium]